MLRSPREKSCRGPEQPISTKSRPNHESKGGEVNVASKGPASKPRLKDMFDLEHG